MIINLGAPKQIRTDRAMRVGSMTPSLQAPFHNWLELVWADGGYNAHQVTDAAAKVPGLRVEII